MSKHPKLRDRFGKLTIGRWKRAGGSEYYCVCDCGGGLYLTVEDIRVRSKLGLGCCLPNCNHSLLSDAAWHDPDACIRLQWRAARHVLCAEWGGTGYGDVPPAEDGLDRFSDAVWPLLDVNGTRWWVHRIDDTLPLYDLNITVEEYPDTGILDPNKIKVAMYAGSYTLSDLAKCNGLDPLYVLQVWSETEDEEEFIGKILAELKGTLNGE